MTATSGTEHDEVTKVLPQVGGQLGHYYKELAATTMLSPQEELETARKIEALEQDLWSHLLSYPQLLDLQAAVISRGLEQVPDFLESLRRQAQTLRRYPTATRRRRFVSACGAAAVQIHRLDQDRRLMQEVVRELRTVAAGERKRLGANRIPVDIKSSRFQDYLARMESLSTVAQSLRDKFIKANLRLVVKIAHKLNHGRMPLSDLIQEGNIGLIKAVERFDHRRGFRFSTYAVWWIRHSIGRALANRGRVVRLPVHHVDLQRRISRTSSELGTKLGRAPTAEEIACGAGLPFEKVEQLLDRPPDRNVSLDRSISDEDDRSFVDLLASPGSLGPVEKIEQQSVSDVVRHLLGDLEPVEVDVLHKRFGLDGEQALTLREIGKRYNLSRERIRQIQERALHKLRRGLRQNNAI